jgi:hypothetical protein
VISNSVADHEIGRAVRDHELDLIVEGRADRDMPDRYTVRIKHFEGAAIGCRGSTQMAR